MSLSRRFFLADASAFGLLAALLPEMAAAQNAPAQAPTEDLPHDSYDFWNGFFDSVNPYSENYGSKAATRGPADQLPDPQAQTQYLQYSTKKKALRYASDIEKEELLDYEGDVTVSIAIAQYRPGAGEANLKASQLRIDTYADSPSHQCRGAPGMDGHRIDFSKHSRQDQSRRHGLPVGTGNSGHQQDPAY